MCRELFWSRPLKRSARREQDADLPLVDVEHPTKRRPDVEILSQGSRLPAVVIGASSPTRTHGSDRPIEHCSARDRKAPCRFEAEWQVLGADLGQRTSDVGGLVGLDQEETPSACAHQGRSRSPVLECRVM